eukprot:CAMPEP_0116558872 /NCGR_PEP_ID=MMETSP0397-20121206/10065_1 /TAXON_ID=216820 /ORGANISM="Cyclophora tenuis, Strain ECT3854" /LENGTH=259 /DNA_ID=CAMNT_0004084545 /DNA_START=124 /DNA_END=903 /DNA_ORIENTATION=-
MGRTQETAQHILSASSSSSSSSSSYQQKEKTQSDNDDDSHNLEEEEDKKATRTRILPLSIIMEDTAVRLEPRLREVAKGAREGQPKWMTYDQAVEQQLKLQEVVVEGEQGEKSCSGGMMMPELETEEQVWSRLDEWLTEAVWKKTTTIQQQNDKESFSPPPPLVQNVLVVSHSGTIRTLLCRLVPDQLPSHIDTRPAQFQNTRTNRLEIPNTSVTVVDLHHLPSNGRNNHNNNSHDSVTRYKNQLRVLTWTGHLGEKNV